MSILSTPTAFRSWALSCAQSSACLGYAMKQLAARSLTDESKRAVACVAVQAVEQVWTTIHGTDKLNKALETAEALLKKGIDFDADEMEVLIEAAVAEFNEAFKKPQESTTDAVRRAEAVAE